MMKMQGATIQVSIMLTITEMSIVLLNNFLRSLFFLNFANFINVGKNTEFTALTPSVKGTEKRLI
jgi:hypothetical protein